MTMNTDISRPSLPNIYQFEGAPHGFSDHTIARLFDAGMKNHTHRLTDLINTGRDQLDEEAAALLPNHLRRRGVNSAAAFLLSVPTLHEHGALLRVVNDSPLDTLNATAIRKLPDGDITATRVCLYTAAALLDAEPVVIGDEIYQLDESHFGAMIKAFKVFHF